MSSTTVFVSESIADLFRRAEQPKRLRVRRWGAKFGRRLHAAYKKRENGWRGDHRRWWEEGRQQLAHEAYLANTPEDEREECPF